MSFDRQQTLGYRRVFATKDSNIYGVRYGKLSVNMCCEMKIIGDDDGPSTEDYTKARGDVPALSSGVRVVVWWER